LKPIDIEEVESSVYKSDELRIKKLRVENVFVPHEL
jgi:hypothetical protein